MQEELIENEASAERMFSGPNNKKHRYTLEFEDYEGKNHSLNLVHLSLLLKGDQFQLAGFLNKPHENGSCLFDKKNFEALEKLQPKTLHNLFTIINALPRLVGTNFVRCYQIRNNNHWYDAWFDREGIYIDFAVIPSEKILAILNYELFDPPANIDELERIAQLNSDLPYDLIRDGFYGQEYLKQREDVLSEGEA